MKNILFIILSIIGISACRSNKAVDSHILATTQQKDYVEILYFHGRQRCVTCNAIEKLSQELVEKEFAEQVKNGKVIFNVIDISTKEGEKIANKYNVAWSSLYIVKWSDGAEFKNNMTDIGFSYAKNTPNVFQAELKKKIEELLK